MLNSTALEILYTTLPESAMPWVTRSLTINEAVCDALKDETFAQKAASEFKNNPLLWTPGNLALFSLNSVIQAQDLQAVESPSIPKSLKSKAAILYEQLRNQDFSFFNEYSLLEIGGLVALHMLSSAQVYHTWDVLIETLQDVRQQPFLQKSIISSLFSYLNSQKTFLKEMLLVDTKNEFSDELMALVVYGAFTNSLPDTSLISLFSYSLDVLNLEKQIAIIDEIKKYSQEISVTLANQSLLENNNSKQVREDRTSILYQLANQKEQSALKMIETYRSVQNDAMAKLIEIGLSASLDENELQRNILVELENATHLSDKNQAGKNLLNLLVNGFDSLNLQLISKSFEKENINLPEYAFYKGLIAIKNGDKDSGLQTILQGVKELKKHGTIFEPFMTTMELVKKELADSNMINVLNEALYEVYPDNEDVKREVLKTYVQKGMHEKAIPVNLSLLSNSPTNTEDLLQLADNYAETAQWDKSYQTYEKVLNKEKALPVETKFNFAKVCLNNQYFEKAESVCDDLLDENFDKAHRVLATISKETKNYPKMVLHLKKAIEAEPEGLSSWHELSEHLMNNEEFDSATPLINDGLNLFPDDSVLQYFKGVLDSILQNYDEAIDHFKISLSHFDGQSLVKLSKEDILKKLVKAYYKTANYSALVDCTSLYLQTYPDAIYLQKYYALGLLQTGNRKEGVELLAQLIRNGEDSGLVLESYIQSAETVEMALHSQLMNHLKKINVFELQMHYAEVLIDNEQFGSALEVLLLEKKHLQTVRVIKNILLCAFKLNRKDLIDAYIDAKVDFEMLSFNEIQDFVSLYTEAGKHHRVLDLLLMTEEKEEKSLEFVLWYAKSLSKIGRSQNAVDALVELMNTGIRAASIYLLLGKLYFDLDDKLNGLVAFDDAIECEDVQAIQMKDIADFFAEKNDVLNQIRFLKEAIKLSATSEFYYELAIAYQNLQNPFEALNSVQLGLGVNSAHLNSLILQSSLLKELGRLNAALASIEKAIQVAPQNVNLYAELAEINLLLGNFDDAFVQIPILEKINSVDSEVLIGKLNFFSLHFEKVLGQKFDSAYPFNYEAMQVFSALLLNREEEIMILLNQHLSNLDTKYDFFALQAIYLAKKGDLVAAKQSFEQGYDAFEFGVDSKNSIVDRYLSCVYFGMAAAWLHDWDVAGELIAKANEIYPAVMVQNYLIILVKMMARFAEPVYDVLEVKSHAKNSLPYLKHYDLEIHRLQSIQLKCIDTQQVNELFVLNSLMSGQEKPIESLKNEFEVSAYLLGNPTVEQVSRLFEMKTFSVNLKLLAGALFEKSDADFADGLIDSMTGMLEKNALVNVMVAKNLEKGGNLLDAMKVWEGAIKIWDNEPKWLGRYAKLLMKVGLLDKASHAFEKGLSIDSSNVEMTLALGDLHTMRNSFGDASEHYANAVQKGMSDERVFVAYSKSLQEIDKPVLAEKMAIKAIETDPNNVKSVLNYAEILAANQDYRRAQVALKKAKSMASDDANVLAFEVKLLDEQGDYAEAIEILNAQQSGKKLSKEMKIQHAALYAKSGNAANSIAILESMIKEKENDTDVAFALFKLYIEEENSDKALQYGQVALQNVTQSLTKSDVVVLYEELAKILHSKGQLDQAVHYLDEAITISPNKASLYLEIAEVFVLSRQYERALNYLQESTRLGIQTVEICILAATLYEKGMDFVHAEDMLKKASELDSKNVEIKRKLKNVIVRKIVGQRGE